MRGAASSPKAFIPAQTEQMHQGEAMMPPAGQGH
jgi:hypothetical protein